MVASSLDTRATLTMYANYNPANLQKIVAGITGELERLLADGVTAKELDDARRGFLQGQEVARTEDSRLAQILESTLIADRTMEYYSTMEQRIVDLTPEKVVTTFRKHIDPKKILTAASPVRHAAEKGRRKRGSIAAPPNPEADLPEIQEIQGVQGVQRFLGLRGEGNHTCIHCYVT